MSLTSGSLELVNIVVNEIMSGKFVHFELNKAAILFLTNNDGLDAMKRIF